MKIQKLKNGILLVPKRIENDGIIGDTVIEVKPASDDYNKYLEQYQREQELILNEEDKESE